MTKPKVQPHIDIGDQEDWCHLCGRRSAPNVIIASCANAEHPENDAGTRATHARYPVEAPLLRICRFCVNKMQAVGDRSVEPFDFKVLP